MFYVSLEYFNAAMFGDVCSECRTMSYHTLSIIVIIAFKLYLYYVCKSSKSLHYKTTLASAETHNVIKIFLFVTLYYYTDQKVVY